jgi:hypothetical protein
MMIHSHGLPLDGVPAPDNDDGAAGVAATASRSDHRHQGPVRPTIPVNEVRWGIPGWTVKAVVASTTDWSFLAFFPIYVARATTYIRAAVHVTTAGAAGEFVRLGLYNYSDGFPSSLVADWGTVTIDALGLRQIVINQPLQPGWYFLALSAFFTTLQLRVPALASVIPPNSGHNATGAAVDSLFGALDSGPTGAGDPFPNPAPVPGTSFSVACPIWLREN